MKMICQRCQKEMIEKNVDLCFMKNISPTPLLVCPDCGQVFLSEEVQKNLSPTEAVLEGHFCNQQTVGEYYNMLSGKRQQ